MENELFHGDIVNARRIIYTASTFARESLLFLQETGSLKAQKPHTSKRSGLASYLFFIVMSGSGTLCYNKEQYELSPGDCVFLDCKGAYSHTTADDLWALSWVHFNGSSMQGIYEKYKERGGSPVFRPDELTSYSDCINDLYSLASSEDYIKDMRINEKLAGLLSNIMENSWHPDTPGRRNPSRRSLMDVRHYLDTHYNEKTDLDTLSEIFNYNKYYLTRIFSEEYGQTIGSYLIHTRITNAKQLLRFTDMSINEVGSAVGIDDPNYFARVFRKIEGLTPGAYRKLW